MTFKLNGLTVAYGSARLAPANGVLADGKPVVVYGPTGSLVNSLLTASRVRMVGVDDAEAGTYVQMGGIVASYDPGAGTFDLGGTLVRVGSATILPAARTLSNNDYVQVAGTLADDGGVDADTIRIRVAGSSTDLATIRLIGTITDFEDAGHFTVRSVPVDATAIDPNTACPGVTLANDVRVDVFAVPQEGTDVVLATRLSCKPVQGEPDEGTPGQSGAGNGAPGQGQAGNGTPVLSLGGTRQRGERVRDELRADAGERAGSHRAVDRTDRVRRAGSDPSNLDGKTVRVEGYASGAAVIARVVRIDGSLGADQYRPNGNAWGRYKERNVK